MRSREDRKIIYKLGDIKKQMYVLSNLVKGSSRPGFSSFQKKLLKRRNHLIVRFTILKDKLNPSANYIERRTIHDI